MNVPPEDAVRVAPDELRGLTVRLLESVNLPADHVELLADTLVASDLRGVLSHGTRQLGRYVRQFREGQLNPRPEPRVTRESPATAVVDGDGGLGHFAAFRATDLAVVKAKELGTATVVTGHHGHIGAAGTYTRLALPAGCAAMCTSGVDRGSHIPPSHHPRASILGVGAGGPISFAVPTREEPAFVLDMACSFSGMWRRAEELAPVVPDAMLKLMNLSAVTMSLGGILAGVSRLGPRDQRNWPGANQGSFIAVYDIARFMPLDDFLDEMDAYVRNARALQPIPGFDRALLAGGLEAERERDWAAEGVPLGPKHREMLAALAAECGVEPLTP